MAKVRFECQACQTIFFVFPSRAKLGEVKFCSRKCSDPNRDLGKTREQRFWEKVDCSGGPDACWLWLGAKNPDGHGQFSIGDRIISAHRYALELHLGIKLGKLHALHDCPEQDNPACVNWRHLKAGTHQENMADVYEKNQKKDLRPGERNGNARLTEKKVRAIRRLVTHRLSDARIAARFNVCPATIWLIRTRKTWSHI